MNQFALNNYKTLQVKTEPTCGKSSASSFSKKIFRKYKVTVNVMKLPLLIFVNTMGLNTACKAMKAYTLEAVRNIFKFYITLHLAESKDNVKSVFNNDVTKLSHEKWVKVVKNIFNLREQAGHKKHLSLYSRSIDNQIFNIEHNLNWKPDAFENVSAYGRYSLLKIKKLPPAARRYFVNLRRNTLQLVAGKHRPRVNGTAVINAGVKESKLEEQNRPGFGQFRFNIPFCFSGTAGGRAKDYFRSIYQRVFGINYNLTIKLGPFRTSESAALHTIHSLSPTAKKYFINHSLSKREATDIGREPNTDVYASSFFMLKRWRSLESLQPHNFTNITVAHNNDKTRHAKLSFFPVKEMITTASIYMGGCLIKVFSGASRLISTVNKTFPSLKASRCAYSRVGTNPPPPGKRQVENSYFSVSNLKAVRQEKKQNFFYLVESSKRKALNRIKFVNTILKRNDIFDSESKLNIANMLAAIYSFADSFFQKPGFLRSAGKLSGLRLITNPYLDNQKLGTSTSRFHRIEIKAIPSIWAYQPGYPGLVWTPSQSLSRTGAKENFQTRVDRRTLNFSKDLVHRAKPERHEQVSPSFTKPVILPSPKTEEIQKSAIKDSLQKMPAREVTDLANKVYDLLEKRLLIEKDRRELV